jgi:HD-GYP domain-containing protein (c-di-GMP phosphodiesterase class II)
MGRESVSRLFFVFVATTLLVVTIAGGAIILVRYDAIRSHKEQDAADTVVRSIGPALAIAASGEAPADVPSFRIAAERLTSPSLPAMLLWDLSGTLLSATGDGASAAGNSVAIERALTGETVVQRATVAGNDRLVSYVALDSDTVLEIEQDYAPIEASITTERNNLILVNVTVGIALAFILPTILWAALRGLRREYNRLLYLYRTGQSIRSTLDLTDVLEQTAYDAVLFTKAQLGIAVLVEEGTNDLVVTASYDSHGDTRSQHHRKVDEWHMRRSAGTGETVLAEEVTLPYGPLLGFEPNLKGPVQLICAAIQGRDRITALIMVVRMSAQGGFSPAEVQMVEEMAAQASMSVEQAVLFTKLRTYAQEIEVGYDSTLKVLSAALDTRDQDTHGHSERVARLTVALAREMGVPKERLVDMERGALLHDVGKIGVPDAVLRKRAELDDREWEAMQKHPLLAGLMVSKVGFLEGALPILLYHHEKYDGTGYPFGLQGAAIPLEARIFTVVDAFDAMTSDRPYRKAMPVADAMEEIRTNANIQFDPEVVVAFERVIARAQPHTHTLTDEDAA